MKPPEDPAPARGRAEATRRASPRVPPPLGANFAVSLIETKLGAGGPGDRGRSEAPGCRCAAGAEPSAPRRHATCCFGVADFRLLGCFFPRCPAQDGARAGARGEGMKASSAGRWCRAAAPAGLESSGQARDSGGGEDVGAEVWEGDNLQRAPNGNYLPECRCEPAAGCGGGGPGRRGSGAGAIAGNQSGGRGAGLPGGGRARTSAAPWSSETSPSRPVRSPR